MEHVCELVASMCQRGHNKLHKPVCFKLHSDDECVLYLSCGGANFLLHVCGTTNVQLRN